MKIILIACVLVVLFGLALIAVGTYEWIVESREDQMVRDRMEADLHLRQFAKNNTGK